MKQLLKAFDLDEVWGLDFETYYDGDYSLHKMATTEYICDSRFEAQMLSIQRHSWTKPRVLVGADAIAAWAKTINWSRAGFLAHHAHFDGLIASRYFDIHPKMYFDTLSMARPTMPVHVGGSLQAVSTAFGFAGKTKAQALVNVMGKRLEDFTKKEIKELAAYAGDDIWLTWQIFHKMKDYLPERELKLIDLTVKLYARPTLILNGPVLQKLADDTLARKQAILESINVDRKELMSNQKFAALLKAQGIIPPVKTSKTTGKPTYAFAKNDLEFTALVDHPNETVAALVEARLGVKSTIVETRAQLMANRAAYGPASVYLNYCGAKTLRWTGGDRSNFQNLGRDSPLRIALEAPKGHMMVIADLSQIEARVNAWFSGQDDMVQMFADGVDVYCAKGSEVFGRKLTKENDPHERFISKVMVLMLQYGAGATRFYESLRSQNVDISESQAAAYVRSYRKTIPFIVANWRSTWNHIHSAFLGRQRIDHKVLTYEGFKGRGVIYGPDGTYMRYDKIQADEDGMTYATKWRRLKSGEISETRQRLYGGLLVENAIQYLSRAIIAEHTVNIADTIPSARLAMSTHDEIVFVIPKRSAKKALRLTEEIMSTPPDWARDLPVAVEAHMTERYDK